MLIIPAIDLRHGRCVRLTQGRKDSAKVYDEDPIAVACRFEADNARMLHVVNLDGAFAETDSTNRAVLREIIRRVKVPVQFGGGVRSLPQVKDALDLGVTRVVIGTLAIEAPDIVREMIGLFGPRQIVVGIDAVDGQVMTHGWETKGTLSATTLARKVAGLGVERVVYTDVQRDGMLAGPNLAQTCAIAGVGLKVTASGGVSSIEDLKRLQAARDCGIDSVIIGKALYEGRFSLTEALEALASPAEFQV
jgi:phosphoribosylformimino-5-aminoimidazole carboxamide ribotide isomerase